MKGATQLAAQRQLPLHLKAQRFRGRVALRRPVAGKATPGEPQGHQGAHRLPGGPGWSLTTTGLRRNKPGSRGSTAAFGTHGKTWHG